MPGRSSVHILGRVRQKILFRINRDLVHRSRGFLPEDDDIWNGARPRLHLTNNRHRPLQQTASATIHSDSHAEKELGWQEEGLEIR